MAKILLRSGSLDDFQPSGENGQSVFDSALQIREALRLRKQQSLVNALAIPQVNDDGDRVDWYAPFSGAVSGWNAADAITRERALASLENIVSDAQTLSKRCLVSDNVAQMRFGALLSKAIQFPGSNHVYLVDGQPVITFWGFVNLNESTVDDVLACLAIKEPVAEPEPEIEIVIPEIPAAEPTLTLSEPDAPLHSPVLVPSPLPVTPTEEPLVYTPWPTAATPPAPPPEPEPEPTPRKKRRILPVAAGVVAVIAVSTGWLATHTLMPATVVVAAPEPVTPADMAPAPVKAASVLTASLPLAAAQFTPAPEPAPVEITPPPKDALVMHADEVRAGATTFLDGNWRVVVDFKDPVSGKIPAMNYRVSDNKGTASVTLRGKITCKVDIFSGLHSDGTLMVKTRGAARCSDGARYNMPQIACKASENDAARCTGQYNEETVVPVTFRKVSA